jgi:hypothetical protein
MFTAKRHQSFLMQAASVMVHGYASSQQYFNSTCFVLFICRNISKNSANGLVHSNELRAHDPYILYSPLGETSFHASSQPTLNKKCNPPSSTESISMFPILFHIPPLTLIQSPSLADWFSQSAQVRSPCARARIILLVWPSSSNEQARSNSIDQSEGCLDL